MDNSKDVIALYAQFGVVLTKKKKNRRQDNKSISELHSDEEDDQNEEEEEESDHEESESSDDSEEDQNTGKHGFSEASNNPKDRFDWTMHNEGSDLQSTDDEGPIVVEARSGYTPAERRCISKRISMFMPETWSKMSKADRWRPLNKKVCTSNFSPMLALALCPRFCRQFSYQGESLTRFEKLTIESKTVSLFRCPVSQRCAQVYIEYHQLAERYRLRRERRDSEAARRRREVAVV